MQDLKEKIESLERALAKRLNFVNAYFLLYSRKGAPNPEKILADAEAKWKDLLESEKKQAAAQIASLMKVINVRLS